jgi:acylpyruvate hydrolase
MGRQVSVPLTKLLALAIVLGGLAQPKGRNTVKLATLRINGSTAAARLDGDSYVIIDGYGDVGELLAAPAWKTVAAQAVGATVSVEAADLAPVVTRPSKVVCVGMNYRSHILEMGEAPPEHPTLFAKFADTLIGANDPIEIPAEDAAIDWEAEMAVIIGKTGRRIAESEAADHIAGYSLCNDISMRTWQFRTGEWLQGKNWQNSTPLGPHLTTSDEWSPGGAMRAVLNGDVVQEAATDDLVHGPASLVSYVSTMIQLNPGDVIITGTPGGVGFARQPQRFLTDGDVIEVSIEGLGSLRNRASSVTRVKAVAAL